jgi:hypothetical protein
MTGCTTLYFPRLSVYDDNQTPLMLFCAPLHYLRAVERGAADDDGDGAIHFINRGLCQEHTPAPLGPQLARFLRLVEDIRNRTDDYTAQLSALTLAHDDQSARTGAGEPAHAIISSLLTDPAQKADGQTTENRLWQARLVLTIGEILDEQQQAIKQELATLSDQERAMLAEMRGSDTVIDDAMFATPADTASESGANRIRLDNTRFNAWLTLLKAAPIPPVELWLAASPEDGDQIFTRCEKIDVQPIPLLKLPLPRHIAASPEYVVEHIESFRHASQEINKTINSSLQAATSTTPYVSGADPFLAPYGGESIDKWSVLLDQHFPETSHGRSYLKIYLTPETPIEQLLAVDTSPEASPPHSHGLVGVHAPNG